MSQSNEHSLNIDSSNYENETIETELSIPEHWDLTNEDRYVYAFYNTQSPELAINLISIDAIEIFEKGDFYEVTGLIRSTVQHDINFDQPTILLLGPENDIIAKQKFDLSKLGSLPKNSSRPWKFHFTNEDLYKNIELPLDSWSLAFEIKGKHQLDLDGSWEEAITDETKEQLENIIDNVEPPNLGEVNFMGIDIEQNNNELIVTLLIRNGGDKEVTFNQLPLGIKDATGKEIARGSFTLNNLSIKPNTSKPWRFAFPESMIIENDLDLTTWEAYVIQN